MTSINPTCPDSNDANIKARFFFVLQIKNKNKKKLVGKNKTKFMRYRTCRSEFPRSKKGQMTSQIRKLVDCERIN